MIPDGRQNKRENKLEAILREWGAETHARQCGMKDLAAPEVRPKSPVNWLAKLAPLAAAAVLLVAAGLMLASWQLNRRQLATTSAEVIALRTDLASMAAALRQAGSNRPPAEHDNHVAANLRHAAEPSAAVSQPLEQAALLKPLNDELNELRQTVERQRLQLDLASAAAGKAQRQLIESAKTAEALRADVAKVRGEVAQLTSRYDGLADLQQRQLASLEATRQELERLYARQEGQSALASRGRGEPPGPLASSARTVMDGAQKFIEPIGKAESILPRLLLVKTVAPQGKD